MKKPILALGFLLCALSMPTLPVNADTDGSELHVAEAYLLEIQLGTDWSGVRFQLKTDAGLYPQSIPVG